MGIALSGATCITAALFLASSAFADVPKKGTMHPAEEFEKHCAACHPNGGNTMKPDKTLREKNVQANGVKSPEDIVALMRKPGPGMTKFDRKAIGDREARAIAEYILKTFK